MSPRLYLEYRNFPQRFCRSLNRWELMLLGLCCLLILQSGIHTLWISHLMTRLQSQLQNQQSEELQSRSRAELEKKNIIGEQLQWVNSLPHIDSSAEVLIAVEQAASAQQVGILSTKMTDDPSNTVKDTKRVQSNVQTVLIRYSIRSSYPAFLHFLERVQMEMPAISMTDFSITRIEGNPDQVDISCELAVQFKTNKSTPQATIDLSDTIYPIGTSGKTFTPSTRVDIFNPQPISQANPHQANLNPSQPGNAVNTLTPELPPIRSSVHEVVTPEPVKPDFPYTPIALLEVSGQLTLYLQLNQKTIAVQSGNPFENGTYRVEMLTNQMLHIRNIPLDYLHEIKLEKLGYP